MNENENYGVDEESVSVVVDSDGVSLDANNGSGLFGSDVSSGDAADIEQSVSGGNGTDESSFGNSFDIVSGGDSSSDSTSLAVDYTENLEKIETGIVGLNSLLLLVFMFLLLEWTDRKFSVIVKRFSERKRR